MTQEDGKRKKGEGGKKSHKVMSKTIELARNMSSLNMSHDKIMELVITSKIISTDFLGTSEEQCSDGQFLARHEEKLCSQLSNLTAFAVDEMKRNTNMTVIGDLDDQSNLTSRLKETTIEDISIGFKVFAALVFCPDPVHLENLKPYKFIFDLLTTQSLPTIVRTIVTAIEQDDNNVEFSKFYDNLDQMLELQYQYVRAAFSSPGHLEEVLNKGWSHLRGKTAKQGMNIKCSK